MKLYDLQHQQDKKTTHKSSVIEEGTPFAFHHHLTL
jgi:hypothetical protein